MENQLKEKELRLGNIINDNNNFTMQVVGLFKDEVLLDFEGNEGDVFVYTGKELELLKPIHLTEDILLRLGFEIENDIATYNGKYHEFNIYTDNSKTWKPLDYKGGFRHLYYVHQLQNLFFSLCGEELR